MAVKRHFHLALAVAAVLAITAGLIGIQASRHAAAPVNKENKAAQPLPEANFYDSSDEKVTLADFKGKVVLVNLWATWCPPCLVEMPSLDKLQAKLKDKNFKVVAVALDRSSIMTVESFLQSKDITHLEPYWDKDRQIPLKWRYDGLPTSYLLDKDGNVVEKFDGPYVWDTGMMFSKISAMVE